MPSPFPGMNPYFEKAELWNDFHNSYVVALRDALAPQVAPGYIVRMEQYLYIHELSAEERGCLGRPDLSVPPTAAAVGRQTVGGAAVIAPASVGPPPAVDIERVPYLEVRDRFSRGVVTVIEVLSPANKAA